jgi:chromosome segregation ATPase
LQAVRAENQRLQTELANSEVNRQELNQELAQLRSQLETERSDREKVEAELSTLNAQLATALEQNQKSAPIAIDVEVGSQLEQQRADRQEIQAELSELKQNSPSAATLFDKSTLDTAIILNQIRTRRKKLKINLQDLQVILEILESSAKKI